MNSIRRICPSCSEPVSVDETLHNVGSTDAHVHCSNCGTALSLHPDEGRHVGDELTVLQQEIHRPGDTVAHFRLKSILGMGSFGAVWLAEDKDLARLVALKLPKSSEIDTDLLREARTAALLRHPAIVAVHEVGEASGQAYIASEYIEGESLRDEVRRERPSIARAVDVIGTVARAAHHAHENEIIHRDLKPANVILDCSQRPHITDFGIAKRLTAEESISSSGQIVGTIAYMSPEQAVGNTAATDRRSDVYSLGVMLFEMLTGSRPFQGSAQGILHQKNDEEAPSPRTLVPALPRDLETICLKCLQRDPSRRYQSAEELADELDRFRRDLPILARPTGRVEKIVRWCRRQPLIAGLLLTIFLTLLLGMASSTFFWGQARDRARETADTLYRSDMYLAGELWARGELVGLNRTLDRHGTDTQRCEFCWHYFKAVQQPFVRIANHGADLLDVAVSHDGRMFASVGRDQFIRVWQTSSDGIVRTLGPFQPQENVTAICFSTVDDRLASAHADGDVRIWNPALHDHSVSEFQSPARLTTVRWSPSGRWVATGDTSGDVCLWSAKDGTQIAHFNDGDKRVLDVRFSPNSSLLAVARAPGHISIYRCAEETRVAELPLVPRLTAVTFLEDEQRLLAVTESGVSFVFHVESGQSVGSFPAAAAAIGDVEFLSAADLTARVDTSGRLILLNDQLQMVREIPTHTLTFGMMAVSGDGRCVVTGSGDGVVKILDVERLRRPDVLWQESEVRSVAFAGDSRQLAIGTGTGALQLWNLTTGEAVTATSGADASLQRSVLTVTRKPGQDVFVCGGMMRELLAVSSEDGRIIEEHRLDAAGHCSICYSPDEQWLAIGRRSGAVLVFAADDLSAPVQITKLSDVRVNDVCFTADSSTLLVACSDNRILFLARRGNDAPERALTISSMPLSLVVCDQGRILAIGTQAGDIHLHSLDASRPDRVVRAHAGRVNDLAVFPDGRRIVSGGRSSELCVWDATSGERITTLYGHRRQVFCVAVSPDGSTIASGGLDGDVRVWRSR